MAKKSFNIVFLLVVTMFCLAQKNKLIDSSVIEKIDSLKGQLILQNDDSIRITIMEGIGFCYEVFNVDSSLKYTHAALDLARQRRYAWGEARLMASLSGILRQQGNLAEALDFLFKSLKIARDNNLSYDEARAYRRLGIVYYDLENFPKAIEYTLRALNIDEQSKKKRSAAIDHLLLGDSYEKMNKLNSATFHLDAAFKQKDLIKDGIPDFYKIIGNIQVKKGNYKTALYLYEEGFERAEQNSNLVSSSEICANISALFITINKRDSAIFYALKGFHYGQEVSFKKGIIDNGSLLAELYDSSAPVAAFKYYKIVAAAKDSLFGINNIQTIQNLVAREDRKQKELEDAKSSFQSRLRWYGVLAVLLGLLLVAFILYRNNKQKQKANSLLTQQKNTIENTLKDLKSAQAQLIQSEKMASLGELTAGIAHEIQNPLNFVNNFFEISNELIDEMKSELETGNLQLATEIANDVKNNLDKINHHGKRADAIVKGMLQHSRVSTGQKEPTNINTLADEYLRLSYQGMRAKDNSFNATLETDFDGSIGKIDVVPQDIGRVLLNLYNNAFFAINERRTVEGAAFKSLISVSTKKEGDKTSIKVRDNGMGISPKIIDKIFQPFFTTKPTGQGTGLGLSLRYDIIKAHCGQIKVDTKEGEGTTFIIILPQP